jgi:cyclopropane fatty-acyl-phospholipid synthase-like methyltransferase
MPIHASKISHSSAHPARSAQELAETSIRSYYDQTWTDYQLVWFGQQTRGIHFGYWDDQTHSHAESLLNTNKVLAERIGVRAGQRILDAGCGAGDGAVWLARHYGVEVTGITLVPSQIARARAFAHKMGVSDNVHFEVMDYTKTTFADSSFDVVWAVESVCHTPTKNQFIQEAYRVLKPGGRFGMIEYLHSDQELAPAEEAYLRRWLSHWAIANLATSAEFFQWLNESGFTDQHYEDITMPIKPSFDRLYRLAMLVLPVARLLRMVRLATKIQFENKLGSIEGYRALAAGLWHDGLITATRPLR